MQTVDLLSNIADPFQFVSESVSSLIDCFRSSTIFDLNMCVAEVMHIPHFCAELLGRSVTSVFTCIFEEIRYLLDCSLVAGISAFFHAMTVVCMTSYMCYLIVIVHLSGSADALQCV